jgi:glycosyltransferase involved in cell wall biosynthesis
MITLLTRPIIPFKLREIRYFYLSQINRFRGLPPRGLPAYGGHPAVTRSICEGLKDLAVEYRLDPKKTRDVSETVICIGDPRSLRQAIQWKRKGKIKKLLAGSTIIESPLDGNGLILSKYLDRHICFSDWHKRSFEIQAPSLKDKLVSCPFGVDAEFWAPSAMKNKNRRKILFYKKRAPEMFYNNCLNLAKEAGYEVEEIVYGNYTIPQYLEALGRNSLLVNWVDHETQGISMAEAWAANVPTFAWDPGATFYPAYGKYYVFDSSSAPYLTQDTGRFFRDADEFANLLELYETCPSRFEPRKWVLTNLTDAICAKKLLDIIESI